MLGRTGDAGWSELVIIFAPVHSSDSNRLELWIMWALWGGYTQTDTISNKAERRRHRERGRRLVCGGAGARSFRDDSVDCQ